MLLVDSILENAAAVAPNAIAATLANDVLTFAEIDERANRIANVLSAQGVGRGDRVLWWSDTDLAAVPVFAALAKLGAVFAPLNARASLSEVTPVGTYARPRLVLAGASHTEMGAELASGLGVPFGADLDVKAADASTAAPDVDGRDERDPHVIFFTSGSTGRPKGVVLSHRTNWLRTFVGATTSPGGGGTVCMFPLFHMAGWTIALGAWQGRRPVHFVGVPDAATLLETTVRHRAARLYCIPAVWGRILEHGVGRYDLSTLVEADTGTSATPPELLSAIKDALPHTVTRVFYGSTEAGPTLSLPDADLFRKPGSVGVAQPGVHVRLSERGEVCARSPFLMDGYFDDPDATNEALVDGWYHTGDLGALDDDGYVSIVGRAPRRDSHRRRDGRPAGSRGRARYAPRRDRGRRRRRSRRALGRGRNGRDRRKARRPAPDGRLAPRLLRRPSRRLQTAPEGRDRQRPPPHRRHRPDPTPPDRRTTPTNPEIAPNRRRCGRRGLPGRRRFGPAGSLGSNDCVKRVEQFIATGKQVAVTCRQNMPTGRHDPIATTSVVRKLELI